MLRKLLLPLLFVGFFAAAAFAQTGSITGTVTNAEGEPIPTANVFLVEAGQGDATNLEGEYTIDDVPAGTYTLRVSFIGYAEFTEQITIEAGQTLENNVTLQEGAVGLEELVVTGYGREQTRLSVTGAIGSVSAEEFEDIPVQSAVGALQGRVAGVRVTSNSGTPGAGFSVRIRGRGSINAGTRPLYIVDGVQLSFSGVGGTNSSHPTNIINPAMIESIEVLKGAAAASIYGAQAGNGVVIITTKSGTEDTRVSFSVNRGVSQRIKNIDYWNTDQLIEYRLASIAYDNPGFTSQEVEQEYRNENLPAYGFDPSTPFSQLPSTDWYDFVSRDGISQEYRLQVSGGGEASTYLIAGSYERVEGFLVNNFYKNYRLAGRFDQRISDKFSLDLNINLSQQGYNGPCQNGFFVNCAMTAAAFTLPLTRPYLEDGSFSPFFPFIGASNNPAIQLNERTRTTDILHLLGSMSAVYEFSPWLSLNTTAALDYRQEIDGEYRSPIANPAAGGSVFRQYHPTTNVQLSSIANFRQNFDDVHNISGLAGIEYRVNAPSFFGASGDGLPNNRFNVLSATATPISAYGSNSSYRRLGFLAGLDYNYDERYYISVSGRYDGDSRFGEENRYGFFPSISGAWAISQEDFFNIEFIEFLKVRAGYGATGNAQIGYYAARGLFSVSSSYAGQTGITPSQLANPRLTWEESQTLGAGIDFGMFEGRIDGSISIYRKTTASLLLDLPLPVSSGWGGIESNIGSVENRGIEFSIRTVNVRTNDFVWSTRFNIGYNQNEITDLVGDQDVLFPAGIQPLAIGRDIDAWKVYDWAGVNPADGRPMWYDADGNITYSPDPGDDRIFYDASSTPVTTGLGTNFSYKGLSLSVFFQASFGQKADPRHVTTWGIDQVGGSGTNGIVQRLTEAWREPGDFAQYAAPTTEFAYPGTAGLFITSTATLYDASYIRLKSAKLGYTLPASITQPLGISSLELYASGLNLALWTSWIGYDPEVAGDFTVGVVPNSRIINGGISVQF